MEDVGDAPGEHNLLQRTKATFPQQFTFTPAKVAVEKRAAIEENVE